jgi:hypothetical protein
MASEIIDLASNYLMAVTAEKIANCEAVANTSTQPLSFTICNTSAIARSFSLYRVPPAGGATAGNQFVADRTIAAKATVVVVEAIAQGLPAGFSIWGSADAASALSVAASGARYTNE